LLTDRAQQAGGICLRGWQGQIRSAEPRSRLAAKAHSVTEFEIENFFI